MAGGHRKEGGRLVDGVAAHRVDDAVDRAEVDIGARHGQVGGRYAEPAGAGRGERVKTPGLAD